MKTTGTKYDSTRDIKEIAKLVRQDIKAAVKAGDLPKLKASVRISRYSMGQSLDVEIKEVDCPVANPDRVADDLLGVHPPNHKLCTDEAYAVKDKVQVLVDEYNYDNSDSMTDYFDVNFYCRVNFSFELKETSKVNVLKRLGVVAVLG